MAAKTGKSKINDRQRTFAEEYLKDLNGKRSAIAAGYSEKTSEVTASQLLRNPKVAAYIQEKMDERAKETGISAAYVLNSLKEVAERCMQHEPVLDNEGNPTGEYQFKDAGAIRALELLGKHLILFTDKTEHKEKIDISVTQKTDFTGKTKEELTKMLFDQIRDWNE